MENTERIGFDMLNYLWWMFEFSICLVDIVLLHWFLSQVIEKKQEIGKFIPIGCIAVSLIAFTATVYSFFSVGKTVLGLFTYLIYASIFFNGELKKKGLYVLVVYLLFAFVEIIAVFLVMLGTGEIFWNIVNNQEIHRIYFTIVSRILFMLTVGIVANEKNKNNNYLPMKYWMIFIFVFSLVMVVALLLLDMSFVFHEDSFVSSIILLITMTLFLIYLSVYYLYGKICEYFTEIGDRRMLEYQSETIEKYMVMKESADKQLRVISHDLKHYMIRLRAILDEKDIENALLFVDDYTKKILQTDLIETGCPMGNAIINQCRAESLQNDIAFKISGRFEQGLNMEQKDICVILGNVLDNAIEAAIKVTNNDNRKICVSIKKDGNYLYLEVENGYEVEPIKRNGVFITSKSSRVVHGVGIQSVKLTVRKYEGSIDFTYGENIFTIFIMLPVY